MRPSTATFCARIESPVPIGRATTYLARDASVRAHMHSRLAS
jgi:hypothetical protein